MKKVGKGKLKMYDLWEAFEELNEIYLTEGTHYDKKAIQKIVDSGLFNEEIATKIINALFKEDIHAFTRAPAWLTKYLVGIANMLVKYCNGDPSKAQVWLARCPDIFDDYLTEIKEIRPKLSQSEQLALDKKFNEEMTLDDVEAELDSIAAKRAEEDDQNLAGKQFENTSDYELIPIDSYNQMHNMFGGHWTGNGTGMGSEWCHTNGEYTYDGWVNNGKNKFFVLAKKGWKDIPFDPVSNSQNPKDEYGNSLIAILVGVKTGLLKRATLRCNHVGVPSNADNQYRTYSELSEIAGFNVQEDVRENLPELVDEDKLWASFDGTAESLNNICDSLDTNRLEITSVVIPDSVTEIGSYAFRGCAKLTSIKIPNSVTKIGDGAFLNCFSLESIEIPDSVTEIDSEAFWNCDSLTSITIPDGVSKISSFTFFNCNSLTSITIPNVTHIDIDAFTKCNSLTSITIPNNVTHIAGAAFWDCTKLTSIIIPNSVTYIGDDAFDHCDALKVIYINSSNKNERVINVLRQYADVYDKDTGELLYEKGRER